jgi:hypothetical protein
MLPLPFHLKLFLSEFMKKEEEEKVKQPSLDAQQIYLSLISNDAEEVGILRTKKKYKIRWLKNGQLEKLSRLLLHKKTIDEKTTTGSDVLDAILEDNRLACKAAAIIILDGYWKIKFRYWWLWRWFYYVRQYDNIQLHDILEVGKKKVPLNQFFATIMSLTEAKDSLMRMRAKEVEATLHGLNMAARSQTESKDNGS